MRLHRPSSRITQYASRSGVALIITVIMLSVITFLAVAFLALSGREKGAVKTATDQTTARLAADTALTRALGELLAGILAAGSVANYDLLVSTNYINWNGFDATPPPNADRRTNVNYSYPDGSPLTVNDAIQNVANLFYDPPAPVFITNRLAPPFGSNELRSYLDLNRNHRLDLTGYLRVTNAAGLPTTNIGYVTGDPQWIGALERPEQPHSSSNKFPYRYSFVAVPVGKTLDVNYSHNQAFNPGKATLNTFGQDYYRNQGVGTWEINLAAFLYDLNTNAYAWGGVYTYDPLGAFLPTGNAFVDAGELYRYRLNGDRTGTLAVDYANNLPGANPVLGSALAFTRDFIDGYSAGPLITGVAGLAADPDLTRTNRPWSGADNPQHFFTTQEFFDTAKTSFPFSNRLGTASASLSTYDQYTYYRLLSQLGTDSAPEGADKLNLNYVNVGGLSATNFIAWTDPDLRNGNVARGIPFFGVPGSVLFFTNVADRLLAKYTAQWLADDFASYTNTFGTTNTFGVTNIPVWMNSTTNHWAYTPSVHRLLQIAANIVDAKTNRADPLTLPPTPDFPTVFRPIFRTDGSSNVYIANFVEVTNANSILGKTPRALISSSAADAVLPDDLIYDVPLVIGAKKGFPNFNEFAMQNVFRITRKLQVTRDRTDAAGRPIRTNMMYVIGISNALGVELWNSYASNYPRAINIYVTNEMFSTLTNLDGTRHVWTNHVVAGKSLMPPTWPANNFDARPNNSFVVPLNTNISIVSDRVYRLDIKQFTNSTSGFLETGLGFPQPQWGLDLTNRLQLIMVDQASQRVLDYVHLSQLSSHQELSEDIRDADGATLYAGLWSTNYLVNSTLPQGVFNQINVSMGNAGTTGTSGSDTTEWNDYGVGQASGPGKEGEIAYFRKFNSFPPLSDWIPGVSLTITDLVHQVPFTPTKIIARTYFWQANDPLVHYMADDLRLLQAEDNKVDLTKTKNVTNLTTYLGQVNKRYQPWGGYAKNPDPKDQYNPAVKDPGISGSDVWNFMTNTIPTVGWLGRVHRGSPWQTIYMKAADADTAVSTATTLNGWQRWTGNGNYTDAMRTRPMTDRILFDVFTTAINDNASRGQLPINQTNLASWSALFSGVVALTNINANRPVFSPVGPNGVIEPAGAYNPFDTNTWPPLVRLVSAINTERARMFTNGTTIQFVHPGGSFEHVGDILSVPELTDRSPFLNTNAFQKGINDAAYEWLPQQVMSLLRLGEPRFVIYAYGQALRPAENSIITAGTFNGLCTNYQITAEAAVRAVVRVEGSPNRNHTNYPPRLIIERYNYLPPE